MYERIEVLEEPIFTFDAFTDTHVGRGSDSVSNLIDAYKDRVFTSPQSKVITNSGDFTDNGSISEYENYFNVNKSYAEVPFITAIGNHEARWNCANGGTQNTNPYEGTCVNNSSVYAQRYLDYNGPFMSGDNNWDGTSLYYDMWIEGYHFVVLNTEKDLKDHAYLSPKQLEWLDETLAIDEEAGRPTFILLHQIIGGTGEYITEDKVGEQEEELKAVLRKHPNGLLLTGHIHSAVDRSDLYARDWGFLYDMASFNAYVGGDMRAQVGYQINVFEDKIQIRPRDYKNDIWLDEYMVEFSLEDSRVEPSDDTYDLDNDVFTPKAGSNQPNEGVENLFDNDTSTIWHTN